MDKSARVEGGNIKLIPGVILFCFCIYSCSPPRSELTVRTVPPGATVFIDGESAGISPYTAGDLEAGEYRITIRLSGYRDTWKTVLLEKGRDVTEEIILQQRRGRLQVITRPAGAAVRLDGQQAGISPVNLSDLVTGEHHLELELRGYKVLEQTAMIIDNQETVVDLQLVPDRMKWLYKTGEEINYPSMTEDGLIMLSGYSGTTCLVDSRSGDELLRLNTDAGTPVGMHIEEDLIYLVIPVPSREAIGVSHIEIQVVELQTGNTLWRKEAGVRISNPSGGIICYESGYQTVTALDLKTGQARWVENIGDSFSEIIIDHNLVLVRNPLDEIRFYEVKTGYQRINMPATPAVIYSNPGIYQPLIYLGGLDGIFYALDAENYKIRWQFRTRAKADSLQPAGYKPAVSDGVVYFSSHDRHLYAVDNITGEEKWRYYTGNALYTYSPPLVADDTVYFDFDTGNIFAMNKATGTERWSYYLGGQVTYRAVYKDTICFLDHYKNVYLFSRQSGELIIKFKLEKGADRYAAVYRGLVYHGDNAGHLLITDTGTGTRVAEILLEGSLVSRPWILAGTLYLGTDAGCLYALDISSSEPEKK